MKSKSILRLFAVMPILAVLVFTNVYQDPSNIFHNMSEEIASAIISGYSAHIGSGNLDERAVKYNLIKKMPDEVGCVAIGPSLIMCVNKDIVGTDGFFNLGVSGGGLYSALEQLGMLEEYGKKTDRIILCVDSYFFDEKISPPNLFEGRYSDYSNRMYSLISSKDDYALKARNHIWNVDLLEQAFSISYFQGACEQIMRHNYYFLRTPRWWPETDKTGDSPEPYYNSDGSWNYGKNGIINASTQDVIRDCQNYDIEEILAKGRHASAYSLEVFEKLVAYLTEQGIEVELFMCPLAPSLWNRLELNKSEYYMLDEIEELVDQMVEKYNVKVTGSYNPYELGMSDSDFYDARHVRRELLGDYFDFTGK